MRRRNWPRRRTRPVARAASIAVISRRETLRRRAARAIRRRAQRLAKVVDPTRLAHDRSPLVGYRPPHCSTGAETPLLRIMPGRASSRAVQPHLAAAPARRFARLQHAHDLAAPFAG